MLLYGPGVTLGIQRGFPTHRRRGIPRSPQHEHSRLVKFMEEGGKVYACRFALQALYGHGEPSLIPGIIPISPLDVLDIIQLLHRKDNAFLHAYLDAVRRRQDHDGVFYGEIHAIIRARRRADQHRCCTARPARSEKVLAAIDCRGGRRAARGWSCFPKRLSLTTPYFSFVPPAPSPWARSI